MMIRQNDGYADGRGDSGTYAIDNDTCTGAQVGIFTGDTP